MNTSTEFVKHNLSNIHALFFPRNFQDDLGTWQKCVKLAETALEKGKSAVIDNTNLDKESRQKYAHLHMIITPNNVYFCCRYIELAKSHKVECRCFMMNVSLEHVKHNNSVCI